MGMDGISMITPGAVKESTSHEHTAQAEQNIRSGEGDVKDVDRLSVKNRINDEENSNKGKHDTQKDEYSDDENDSDNSETLTQQNITNELEYKEYQPSDFENFYVKIKPDSNTVELYDKITDKLIETIAADELSQLVNRLNIASGIFVNKRV